MSSLQDLTNAGVSIWLDDLSRDRIESGNLENLIRDFSVRGVTTNPTIFAAALKGSSYGSAIAEQAAKGASAAQAIAEITSKDVADACDIFADLYRSSNGVDGRVSIEVEPGLAHNTEATIAQALELYKMVGKENVMIKIPATKAGLPAITEVIANGISVNVTLIFSTERYAEVIDAYLLGLEKAAAKGIDLSKIHSVASFFVSRVDTEVDKRLAALGRSELSSKAALANARLAYGLFLESIQGPRWNELSAKGANAQRPLMASTGVKDPNLPDTLYVSELVAPQLVNTMPEKTLMAMGDHGVVTGNTIEPNLAAASDFLAELSVAGVDFDDVTALLEKEGVEKFIASWDELVASVEAALEAAR
ncbi:transaldolase [Aquiluna sp. KACHI24]|uniref:transaldolase n=1 Tax=Aquiluna sp. KACHI24 TaxID=2968831 RepID=UPI0021FD6E92|nr:transaldolase [Aquiluna sp. KACHI24]BDQ00253.1 transaldolase [Aquiluna sp. KACHI24]